MEGGSNKESKLESLKRRLDSRSFRRSVEAEQFKSYKKEVDGIRTDWSHEGQSDQLPNSSQMAGKKRNFLKTFLILSIVFFVLALGAASYVILGGGNVVSSDNVEILVSGPVSVSGGEVLSLNVIVSNGNNTSLELADLLVEYPEGTRSHLNLSEELSRERFSLDNVRPGEEVNQEIKAILFGEEGSQERIKLTVEYRVAGSNAIFFKEKEYDVEISSAPVSLRIEALKDVNSGQEVSLNISVESNSNNLLEDVLFIAEYPFGWTFKDASPRTSFDQNIWKIGDLSPGEKRTIKINGLLEGQDGEERIFRFLSGIASNDDEKILKTAFISGSQSIFIRKPFLSLDLVLDGSTSQNHSTPLGEVVNVDVLWKNNLPTSVANVQIEAKLTGDIDESSVSPERGFYSSSDNSVLWSQAMNPVFESLSPGESGVVRFSFTSLSFDGSGLANPEVLIDVSVRGRRLSETGVSEEVVSSTQKEVRFDTGLSLVPRIVHFSGPIANTGSIPPKVEQETTYTVVWTLSNTINDASNVFVSAKLPSYVKWTGLTNASGESLTYNSLNREVVWEVGNLKSSTGFSLLPREVSFQISFLPSLSQVGKAPILLEKTHFSGKDDWTGTSLQGNKGELSTKISTDSNYKIGDERVVE